MILWGGNLSNFITNGTILRQFYGTQSDYSTTTYTIIDNRVYLYINSHIFFRCIVMFGVHSPSNTFNDIIYSSGTNAVPTITFDVTNLKVTIKQAQQARGSLFLTRMFCG